MQGILILSLFLGLCDLCRSRHGTDAPSGKVKAPDSFGKRATKKGSVLSSASLYLWLKYILRLSA